MIRIAVTGFFTLLPALFFAQTGALEGTVYSNDQPVELANIQVTGANFVGGAITGSDGTFEIKSVPPGEYIVLVTCLGYKPFSTKAIVREEQTNRLEIDLEQDLLNLEQVVVTGTRNEVPVYNSPVIVNKVSELTFEATQSLSVSEGLNFSPGLRVENNCQNCGFTQLRMNGLEGAYSQILINSRPIFSALAGVYGLDMIPANMVDRIEVVKGGGSALYGGNAIAGTVNIITKDPIQNSFEVGFNQSFINAEQPDRTLTFSGSIVDENLTKGITLYGFNRTREPWDANDDGFSEITKLRNNTFGFDAFLNTSDRGKLKLNAFHINEFRRGGNNFDLAPHQTDITEQLDHNIFGTGLSFEQISKDNRHKISLYTSAQFTNRDSYYGGGGRVLAPNDTLTEADILAINAYGKSNDIAAVGGGQYSFNINEEINLTLGAEYQYNDVVDEMPGYERTIDQTVATLGTYAQLEWDPTDRLRLLFGGRFDYVNINGLYDLGTESFDNQQNVGIAVPRLTAMYNLTEDLKIRASFAQGYRAPQAFDEDLHIETVGGAARFIRLDPDLSTETSNNFTASLNYTKSVGSTQANLVLEGFRTQLIDPFILSDQTELPSGVAVITKRNGSGATVQGINLEANIAFSSALIVQLGSTIQSARYTEAEEIWAPEDPNDQVPPTITENLLRTPDLYGFYTLTYTPVKQLKISLSGVYTGPMDAPHIIGPETEYTIIERTPSFLETNIKVAYTFVVQDNYHIELSGGLQNAFNSYQDDFDIGPARDAGYVYGPARPRTIFFGLKFGLN